MKELISRECVDRCCTPISTAWDNNVLIRAQDIEEKTDLTYTTIIQPWVQKQVLKYSTSSSKIIDIGSGCGYMSNILYQNDRKKIVGIDLSPQSIIYSKKRYPHIPFFLQDIYSIDTGKKFDLCLGVMLLNNLPDIYSFFEKVRSLLSPNGKVILISPHPCFWPVKHLASSQFNYTEEKEYCLKFSTKGRKDYNCVPYFHRPIWMYFDAINKNDFTLIEFCELMEENQDLTPDLLGIVLG